MLLFGCKLGDLELSPEAHIAVAAFFVGYWLTDGSAHLRAQKHLVMRITSIIPEQAAGLRALLQLLLRAAQTGGGADASELLPPISTRQDGMSVVELPGNRLTRYLFRR